MENRNAAGSPTGASNPRGEAIAGIRHTAVEQFFAERVPGAAGPLRFSLISGGRSNLTYRVEDGDGHCWVLRRPPLGHVLPTAHDMVREYRVLSALAETDVPVARPLALCDDPALNDAPFYDWEMATLGDPLADLGYTLIYWTEPGDPAVGRYLPSVTATPGFLRRADLLDRYARSSGRDVSCVDFYQVLALYKLAVISEGIYARWKLGKTLGDGFDSLGRAAAPLAERALAIADASADPKLHG